MSSTWARWRGTGEQQIQSVVGSVRLIVRTSTLSSCPGERKKKGVERKRVNGEERYKIVQRTSYERKRRNSLLSVREVKMTLGLERRGGTQGRVSGGGPLPDKERSSLWNGGKGGESRGASLLLIEGENGIQGRRRTGGLKGEQSKRERTPGQRPRVTK